PVAGLLDRVAEGVRDALGLQSPEPVPASNRLTEVLAARAGNFPGGLLIILDQFEEYFLYHPSEDGPGRFAVEFPRAVNAPDLRVNFLISIREDALARLDRFKGRIPNLFDNFLRINHLRRDAARQAIIQPLKRFAPLPGSEGKPVDIEPDLVEEVLDQVGAGKVVV